MTLTLEQKAQRYDEEREDRKGYNARRNARRNILVRKAIEAGLDQTITEQEMDEELVRMTMRRA